MPLYMELFFPILALIAIISAAFDFLFYRIPNVFMGILLIIFCLFSFIGLMEEGGWNDLKISLLVSGVSLIIGLLFYAMKWMGAGDVKFLFVSILWSSYVSLTFILLFVTSIVGGVIAAICYFFPGYIDGLRLKIVDRIKPFFEDNAFVMGYINQPFVYMATEDQQKVRIPYGVAIACGVLFIVYSVLAGQGIK